MLALEHPEITMCLRTGYPSWMQPRDEDDDEEEDEYEEDDSFGSYDEDDRYDEARYEEHFG